MNLPPFSFPLTVLLKGQNPHCVPSRLPLLAANIITAADGIPKGISGVTDLWSTKSNPLLSPVVGQCPTPQAERPNGHAHQDEVVPNLQCPRARKRSSGRPSWRLSSTPPADVCFLPVVRPVTALPKLEDPPPPSGLPRTSILSLNLCNEHFGVIFSRFALF